jgi:hypothetical protein
MSLCLGATCWGLTLRMEGGLKRSELDESVPRSDLFGSYLENGRGAEEE